MKTKIPAGIIFWDTVLAGIFFGFGFLIWKLARPGFSFWETIGWMAAFYGVVFFYMAWLSIPGAFAIPVKYYNNLNNKKNDFY